MTRQKNCKWCKEQFAPRWHTAIYCSDLCAVMSRMLIGQENDCWLWTGAKNDQGYGQLRIRGRCFYAHRLAYSLLVKEIPSDIDACHACDTPLCCNPEHLFLGTAEDNLRDMASKGRAYKGGVPPPAPRGELHRNSKLTAEIVMTIRNLKGVEPMKRLARNYKVAPTTIRSIMRGKTWKHLLEPER